MPNESTDSNNDVTNEKMSNKSSNSPAVPTKDAVTDKLNK